MGDLRRLALAMQDGLDAPPMTHEQRMNAWALLYSAHTPIAPPYQGLIPLGHPEPTWLADATTESGE